MNVYDIAVVGGGPSGTMAALRSGRHKKNVILIERNAAIGRKLLLTGNGRCNITNAAPLEIFIKSFGKQGAFFKPAFFGFNNDKLMDFFKAHGLSFTIEEGGRVFPVTNEAGSVVDVLRKCLRGNEVKLLYEVRALKLSRIKGLFQLYTGGGKDNRIYARKVILATGGVSYKKTGSSGDGFTMAAALGHTVVDLKPALVPLVSKEPWIMQLQGLSLKDVRLSSRCDHKTFVSPRGEVLFTHYGLSGPLVLDLSATVAAALAENKRVDLYIDLIPGMSHEEMKVRLLEECSLRGRSQMKRIVGDVVPRRMASLLLQVLDIDGYKRAHHIARRERLRIAEGLKRFPVTVTGSLPIERAMVTNGGIDTKEINAKTMESRLVPGLYFAGEIIDGCGKSGGFNLQQAFSTGYLAGEKASA